MVASSGMACIYVLQQVGPCAAKFGQDVTKDINFRTFSSHIVQKPNENPTKALLLCFLYFINDKINKTGQ